MRVRREDGECTQIILSDDESACRKILPSFENERFGTSLRYKSVPRFYSQLLILKFRLTLEKCDEFWNRCLKAIHVDKTVRRLRKQRVEKVCMSLINDRF